MAKKDSHNMVTVDTVLAEARAAKFEVLSEATPVGLRGRQQKIEILVRNPRTDKTSVIEGSGTRGGAFIPQPKVVQAFAAVL